MTGRLSSRMLRGSLIGTKWRTLSREGAIWKGLCSPARLDGIWTVAFSATATRLWSSISRVRESGLSDKDCFFANRSRVDLTAHEASRPSLSDAGFFQKMLSGFGNS